MLNPFPFLATLNQVIIFGLVLLALLSAGHITYRFRLTEREERLLIGIFGLYAVASAVDRGIAAHLINLATAEQGLGVWALLSLVFRGLFAGVVWGMALYVVFGIWRVRMGRRHK